jgi:hypothetical protein
MPPPSISSSASAPPLVLTPRRSRALWFWWCGLHALLATATVLVGVPWFARGAALLAVLGHAIARRPRAAPGRVVLTADGHCAVPEWRDGRLRLGARTLVCPYWIRLDCDAGSWRRDLVLFADQLDYQEWARLRAFLARMGCD